MRILVVEEDAKIADCIHQTLKRDALLVTTAANGTDGLALAFRGFFDAIIIDTQLSDLEGQLVLQRIRQHKIHAPALMLVSKKRPKLVVELLNFGADDCLAKPIHPNELAARVKALIRRSWGTSSPTLNCGDLKIDTLQGTVRRGAEVIDLSHTEFRILRYLACHPQSIVSKEELLARVYEPQHVHRSNIIEAISQT